MVCIKPDTDTEQNITCYNPQAIHLELSLNSIKITEYSTGKMTTAYLTMIPLRREESWMLKMETSAFGDAPKPNFKYIYETIAKIADIISGSLTDIMTNYVEHSIISRRHADYILRQSTPKPEYFPEIPDSLDTNAASVVVSIYDSLQFISLFVDLINHGLEEESASVQKYASVKNNRIIQLKSELHYTIFEHNAIHPKKIDLTIDDLLELNKFISENRYQSYFMILKEVKTYMEFIEKQFQHLAKTV
ncbi:unnamed protein product [Owenia fusiformis]|uniref:Uncharacterized protein n=1 Tax=Owenia fusiformis TaxID=6347 RepID=A0A8S4N2A1_OWEFU|nr:unnamed protein product [Owenia fusiformis]